MPWDNSNRRAQLPPNWAAIRAQILRRDPTCRACNYNASVDVDHITPGDNHNPDNLQGLCRHCHKLKTITERPLSGSAYKSPKRPPEAHPGIVTNPTGDAHE